MRTYKTISTLATALTILSYQNAHAQLIQGPVAPWASINAIFPFNQNNSFWSFSSANSSYLQHTIANDVAPNFPAIKNDLEHVHQQEQKYAKNFPSHWGVKFDWVTKSGYSQTLTDHHANQPLMIASTMKLFTAWFAFEKHAESNSVLGQMLKHSINPLAIAILNRLGGPEAMKKFYASGPHPLGMNLLTINNGAGKNDEMSEGPTKRHPERKKVTRAEIVKENIGTAEVEVDLLENIILKSPRYHEFSRLLVEPNEPGTLRLYGLKRLSSLNGCLYAKTGTLVHESVVSLSGYVEFEEGTLVYSVIGNWIPGGCGEGTPLIDKMITDHVRYVSKTFGAHLSKQKD